MIRVIFSVTSALIAVGCFIPYGIDIVRGRAKPARSTRLMFALLNTLALLQQKSLGSGWALALSMGNAVGALFITVLAVRKGHGGLKGIDIICYLLLGVDLLIWQTSHSAFVALHLTVLADIIAMCPTLVKTWHHAKSETPLFWACGAIAPLFAVAAETHRTYGILLFPIYLCLIDLAVVMLIYYPHNKKGNAILTK